MHYQVRLMTQDDVIQVTEIDREAFPTQWPPANYQHELRNRLANYVVAYDEDSTVDQPEAGATAAKSQKRWFSGLGRLFGHDRAPDKNPPPPSRHYTVGFAGFWVMADEAHITSIAVRESHRRRGIGELLLISALDLAREKRARLVTLEVRVSNTAAQKLYVKYGFNHVGMRRGYYIDRDENYAETKEDGLIMSTRSIASDAFQAQLRHLKQAYSRKWGTTLPGSAANSQSG